MLHWFSHGPLRPAVPAKGEARCIVVSMEEVEEGPSGEGQHGFCLSPNPTGRCREEAHSAMLRMMGAGSILGRRSRLERWLLCVLMFLALNCILFPVVVLSEDRTTLSFRTRSPQTEFSAPAGHQVPAMGIAPARAALPSEAMFGASGNHPIERGLLKVNMESKSHPIYQLIRDARSDWENKLERQSQSLAEAAKEYRRRYGRQPPKGFDRWWNYVIDNKVILPDEYDQIDRDLLPFRALSAEELSRRLEETSRLPNTYTLRVRNGSLHTSLSFEENEIGGSRMRVDGQTALTESIAGELEDFTAVYWVHDNPRGLISYNHMQSLVKSPHKRQHVEDDDRLNETLRAWSAMCPPDSLIWQASGRLEHRAGLRNSTRVTHSFIADHYRSMDICEHPESIPLHGTLAGKEVMDAPLTPLFVLAKTRLHADILGVPVEQVVGVMRDVPWEEKTEEKLSWRGRSTGTVYSKGTPWRSTQRTRLIKLANDIQGEVEILGPSEGMAGRTVGEERKTMPREMANEYYLDVAFVAEPIQCEASDGTCQELTDEYRFTEGHTHDDALYHKYILDVDGNAWSARFQRLLAGGALVFKSTIYPEWWTERMQAWVHYIPIQLDYSDLYSAIAFFRGDLSGKGGEAELARKIANEGKAWANEHWRQADMTAYIFRLYLEWARLLAPQKEESDFVYEERMERMRRS